MAWCGVCHTYIHVCSIGALHPLCQWLLWFTGRSVVPQPAASLTGKSLVPGHPSWAQPRQTPRTSPFLPRARSARRAAPAAVAIQLRTLCGGWLVRLVRRVHPGWWAVGSGRLCSAHPLPLSGGPFGGRPAAACLSPNEQANEWCPLPPSVLLLVQCSAPLALRTRSPTGAPCPFTAGRPWWCFGFLAWAPSF